MQKMLIRGMFITLLAAIAAGCTYNKQLRTENYICAYQEGNPTSCGKMAIEEHSAPTYSYAIGFVELDDQGCLWDRHQLNIVRDYSEGLSGDNSPVLHLVFVHGWLNNAEPDNENLASFRQILQTMATAEMQAHQDNPDYTPRKVLGIYVGWRGLSLKVPLLRYTTFWDRKNTAEKIGHGAATEVLKSIETTYLHAKEKNNNSVMVTIGHSFGGDVVYSALSQILIERYYLDDDKAGSILRKVSTDKSAAIAKAKDKKAFGDLVILINPAFEAARFAPLRELASTTSYDADQLPVLVEMTSKSDSATGFAFPAGRWVSTLFESTRDSAQAKANRSAVGHYQPFFTHELSLLTAPSTTAAGNGTGKEYDLQEITAAPGWRLALGKTELVHLRDKSHTSDPRNPIMVVTVDKEVMDGHSDIFNDKVRSFLTELVFDKIDNE